MEQLKKQLRFRAVFLFHLPSLPGNRILGAPRGAARRSADPAGGPVGPARRGHGVDVALDRAERRIGLGSIWIARAWMPCGSGRMDRTQKKGAETWNVSSHSLWASARSAMAVRPPPSDDSTSAPSACGTSHSTTTCGPGARTGARSTGSTRHACSSTDGPSPPTTTRRRRSAGRGRAMSACSTCAPPVRGADGPHGCAPAPIPPWAARGADCGRSRNGDGPVSIMSLVEAWNHLVDGKEDQ